MSWVVIADNLKPDDLWNTGTPNRQSHCPNADSLPWSVFNRNSVQQSQKIAEGERSESIRLRVGYWNALQVVGVAHQYPFQPSWESKVNFGCGGCRFLCCLWLAGEYLKYPKMNWWMPSTQVWANKSSKFGRAKMEAMSAPWCHCFLSSPADRCDAPADSAKRRWSTQSLPTIPTKKGRGPIRQDWKHM